MIKYIAILIFLGSTFLLADLSVHQIQQMVNKIHERREGVQLKTLQNTKEPFVRFKVEDNISTFVIPSVKKKEVKLTLNAIVNEHAYINNRWVGLNENILGYTLKYIGKRGVVLSSENRIKKLYLSKTKDNIIILDER